MKVKENTSRYGRGGVLPASVWISALKFRVRFLVAAKLFTAIVLYLEKTKINEKRPGKVHLKRGNMSQHHEANQDSDVWAKI